MNSSKTKKVEFTSRKREILFNETLSSLIGGDNFRVFYKMSSDLQDFKDLYEVCRKYLFSETFYYEDTRGKASLPVPPVNMIETCFTNVITFMVCRDGFTISNFCIGPINKQNYKYKNKYVILILED